MVQADAMEMVALTSPFEGVAYDDRGCALRDTAHLLSRGARLARPSTITVNSSPLFNDQG